MKRIAIALTGASGAPYFLRLCERLADDNEVELHLMASEAGSRVLRDESGIAWKSFQVAGAQKHSARDIGATLASGSFLLDALVICPCSVSTLSAVAYGFTENLIHRAASVQLKEGRSLLLVVREMPLSLIHLRAMTAVTEAGARVLPASPHFYHRPQSVLDVVDTVVDRVLDQLGRRDRQIKRWGG